MSALLLKPGFPTGHLREVALASISLAVTTAIALAIVSVTGYVTVALLYLLLVVFAGLNFSRWTVLFIGAACALLWNFLFIPPRFLLHRHGRRCDALCDVLCGSACDGHLTSRLRANQILDLQKEHRTRVLYELVWQAGLALDRDSGLRAAVTLIETLFASRVALLLRLNDHTLSSEPHEAGSLQSTKRR